MKNKNLFTLLLVAGLFLFGNTVLGQEKTYTLVTSMSEIEDGGQYLFVSVKNSVNYALGWQKQYNRHGVPVEVTGNSITVTPATVVTETQDEVFPYEVTIASEGSNWTLFDALNGRYMCPRTGSGNNGLILTDVKEVWNFSIGTAGAVYLKCIGEQFERNTLRFNLNGSNPPLFACYASGQQDFFIYKYGEPSELPFLHITSPAENAVFFDNKVEIEFSVTNFNLGIDGKVKYSVNSGNAQFATSSPISLTGLAYSDHTVNLELVDMDNKSLDPAVTASVTFTCMEIKTKTYTLVTSVDQIEEGKQYLIVGIRNETEYLALGWQRGNNRLAVVVENQENTVIAAPAAVITETEDTLFPYEITFEKEGDNWTLFDGLHEKYLRSNDNPANPTYNSLILREFKAFWSLDIGDNGVATLLCVGSEDDATFTERNRMRLNTTNNPPLFASYQSGQQDIYIYKAPLASIQKKPLDNKLEIYPNPFNDVLNIGNITDVEKVTVTNIVGQKVLEAQPINGKIDTRNLNRGIYLISIQTKDGKNEVIKVVKK